MVIFLTLFSPIFALLATSPTPHFLCLITTSLLSQCPRLQPPVSPISKQLPVKPFITFILFFQTAKTSVHYSILILLDLSVAFDTVPSSSKISTLHAFRTLLSPGSPPTFHSALSLLPITWSPSLYFLFLWGSPKVLSSGPSSSPSTPPLVT